MRGGDPIPGAAWNWDKVEEIPPTAAAVPGIEPEERPIHVPTGVLPGSPDDVRSREDSTSRIAFTAADLKAICVD